jgi:ATP-dependent RNA helicase DDX21
VPQAEDVIKASSRGILKNLEDVNEDVLHLFEDLAKDLIDQYDGDAERALQVALAYSSGHYKHNLGSKSLLNGQEGQTTVRISSQRGRFGPANCYSVLKKYWDPRCCDNIRNMKGFRDGSGVVFDLKSENFESFMDNYARLKETGDRIDFDVAKCAELPDLEDESGYGGSQNWRETGRDNGYGRGGGNGYGNGRGGGMGRGGSRGGGYQGYGSRDGMDSGGWGNRGGGRGGGYN